MNKDEEKDAITLEKFENDFLGLDDKPAKKESDTVESKIFKDSEGNSYKVICLSNEFFITDLKGHLVNVKSLELHVPIVGSNIYLDSTTDEEFELSLIDRIRENYGIVKKQNRQSFNPDKIKSVEKNGGRA